MTRIRYKTIKECEKKLQALRDRYLSTLERPTNNIELVSELIDKATYEQQVQSSNYFRSKIGNLLPEINRALSQIKEGTYGICEITGKEIEEKRLLAVPWTRVSLEAFQKESA